jgi:hypothetical protein
VWVAQVECNAISNELVVTRTIEITSTWKTFHPTAEVAVYSFFLKFVLAASVFDHDASELIVRV